MDNCELSLCFKEKNIVAIDYFVTNRGFYFKYLLMITF